MSALLAIAALLACPASVQDEQAPIEAGCRVPSGEWRLVSEAAYLRIARDLSHASALIREHTQTISELRTTRDADARKHIAQVQTLQAGAEQAAKDLAKATDALAEAARGLEEAPSRLEWAGVGAGTMAVVVGVVALTVWSSGL